MNTKFMDRAIELAYTALKAGEVPVGAVIVKNGAIIGEGANTRETDKCVTGHAEINAINSACETLGDWRLDGCEMYVTLEPCYMCAGAIAASRISTLVFGSFDMQMGCIDSKTRVFDVFSDNKCEIFAGIKQNECDALLNTFFKAVRNGE